MATDQISFYDESLKKQIEGTFISDGKSIHIRSAYGNKSVAYNDLGASIDHNAQVLLVRKLLSELARDPGSGKFKELHQQKDDQQNPMQRPFLGGIGVWVGVKRTWPFALHMSANDPKRTSRLGPYPSRVS